MRCGVRMVCFGVLEFGWIITVFVFWSMMLDITYLYLYIGLVLKKIILDLDLELNRSNFFYK